MIPADVASRLQVSADATLRPVAPAQEISDKLSGLVAGQKIMAEIQALLPNGTYRALINQRNLTLALPFSAKTGDSLELLVTESDGKLTLAVVSPPGTEGSKPATESATATLSRTGQLISTLFSGARGANGGPVSLPLNGNQPLANAPPASAQDILPALKQAITQSGMFYESHQAEWIAGRFPKADLLQEPQGKLSSPAAFVAASGEEQVGAAQPKPVAPGAAAIEGQADASKSRTPVGAAEQPAESLARLSSDTQAKLGATIDGTKSVAAQSASQQIGTIVAQQVQPLVQQQLEALATQNFSWQGQVWPGQEMRWEIEEDAARKQQDDDEAAPQWSTRLQMTLPNLGQIDAKIRLQGNQMILAMSADSAETRQLIRSASLALRSQLNEAGLNLASMGVDAETQNSTDGQA